MRITYAHEMRPGDTVCPKPVTKWAWDANRTTDFGQDTGFIFLALFFAMIKKIRTFFDCVEIGVFFWLHSHCVLRTEILCGGISAGGDAKIDHLIPILFSNFVLYLWHFEYVWLWWW